MNSRHKIIQDTLSEETHKTRDRDKHIARKAKALRSKDTRHSYVEGNTRHTQYPRQNKAHSRRVLLQGRPESDEIETGRSRDGRMKWKEKTG